MNPIANRALTNAQSLCKCSLRDAVGFDRSVEAPSESQTIEFRWRQGVSSDGSEVLLKMRVKTRSTPAVLAPERLNEAGGAAYGSGFAVVLFCLKQLR
jgi:hypothetical protein